MDGSFDVDVQLLHVGVRRVLEPRHRIRGRRPADPESRHGRWSGGSRRAPHPGLVRLDETMPGEVDRGEGVAERGCPGKRPEEFRDLLGGGTVTQGPRLHEDRWHLGRGPPHPPGGPDVGAERPQREPDEGELRDAAELELGQPYPRPLIRIGGSMRWVLGRVAVAARTTGSRAGPSGRSFQWRPTRSMPTG